MSDYAVPRWVIAVGEDLDCISQDIKTGGNLRRAAARLRREADKLEGKI